MSARPLLARALRVAAIVFAAFYLLALGAWVVSSFGLFGVEPTAFSGIFLVLLGAPWVSLASDAGAPAGERVGVLAPLINLAILMAAWRLLR